MTSTSCCANTIPLSRPLHQRAWDALFEKMHRFQLALQAHAEQRRRERELDAVADMNEFLLKDIGAPDWMITQAHERREADRQLRLELHHGGRFRA